MKAAVFRGVDRPLAVEEVADPVPGAGDVVIKVGRCGICGSDKAMASSPLFGIEAGTAFGHEFSGEVVELGKSVDNLAIGDRISAMPATGCGACAACYGGHPYACDQLRLMMGGFGQYALARAGLATRLPDGMSLAEGAMVEPLAAALRAVSSGRLGRGANILVLGAGSMGLGTVFWARQLGAGKIVVAARSAWRRALALRMGADGFLPDDDELAASVRELMGGPPDAVFECVGVPGMIRRAIDLVRPRGTVIVEGCCIQTDQFVPLVGMSKEICVQFTAAYTLADFRHTVDTLNRGLKTPLCMITDTLPLAAAPRLVAGQEKSERTCKAMIDPWMHAECPTADSPAPA